MKKLEPWNTILSVYIEWQSKSGQVFSIWLQWSLVSTVDLSLENLRHRDITAGRHYDKETRNWQLGLLLLYWLPCIPFAGPEIPRGCNPLGKVKLIRNSKSQHSSGCWAHPPTKLSVLFVQSTAHSQPPQLPSDPAGLWPNMRLFTLLMAFSLPTQAVREQ